MKSNLQPLVVLAVVLVAVLTLLLIGWWLFGSALAFLAVFPWIVSSLTSAGIHSFLARALGLPVAALAAWAITQTLSLSSSKRRRGLVVCMAIYVAWAASMWMMTRRYNFDPVTGAVLQKYAATPYGFEPVPAKWNVHPIFGTRALPMTADVARSIELQAQLGTFVSAQDPLFAPDGSPLVWYCETPEAGIELFRRPGRHPRLNVPLLPITADIARRLVTGGHAVNAAALPASKFDGLQRLREHLERTEAATSKPAPR